MDRHDEVTSSEVLIPILYPKRVPELRDEEPTLVLSLPHILPEAPPPLPAEEKAKITSADD